MTETINYSGQTDVSQPLWRIGWEYPKYTLYGILASILLLIIGAIQGSNPLTYLGILGFFATPIITIVGAIHVRRNYQTVFDTARTHIQGRAKDHASPDTAAGEWHQLRAEKGTGPFGLPCPYWDVTPLVVEDSLLVAHNPMRLRLPQLAYKFDPSTTDIYFDQVTNIEYDASAAEFAIRQSGGSSAEYPSEDRPDDLMSLVQERVRNYKRTAV